MAAADVSQPLSWDTQLAALRPQLISFARMRLRDACAAEDLVQDAIVAAIEHARQFEGRASTRTWVTAILKNKIVDHVGRTHRERGFDAEGLERARHEANDRQEGTMPLQDWHDDPQESLAQRQFLARLDACIECLPPQMAEVFMMRACLGMTTDEICTELGITPSNCWVILCRARTRLRERLRRMPD